MNTAQAFDVADHIALPKGVTIDKDAQWTRLDAIVKQWIYGTISVNLLHTILKPGATAKEALDRLQDIFHNNKNSCAVFLEQQFTQIQMDAYPTASAYCQALKMLADQLANVGAPITEERLILRLVAGISSGYSQVATIIQQRDPLPSFYQARSMLTLEEARQQKTAPPTSETALLASANDNRAENRSDNGSHSGDNNRNNQNNNRNKGGRGKNYRGKNGGGGGSKNSNRSSDNSRNSGGQQ
ncbi:uncharacterized protein LOC141641402 [Silene latifolia]|uniref:uncharacterized protein LOC141641402 n=1 Tax=Silene latifolia TaxID=37657 RepID=UPI003D78A4A6